MSDGTLSPQTRATLKSTDWTDDRSIEFLRTTVLMVHNNLGGHDDEWTPAKTAEYIGTYVHREKRPLAIERLKALIEGAIKDRERAFQRSAVLNACVHGRSVANVVELLDDVKARLLVGDVCGQGTLSDPQSDFGSYSFCLLPPNAPHESRCIDVIAWPADPRRADLGLAVMGFACGVVRLSLDRETMSLSYSSLVPPAGERWTIHVYLMPDPEKPVLWAIHSFFSVRPELAGGLLIAKVNRGSEGVALRDEDVHLVDPVAVRAHLEQNADRYPPRLSTKHLVDAPMHKPLDEEASLVQRLDVANVTITSLRRELAVHKAVTAAAKRWRPRQIIAGPHEQDHNALIEEIDALTRAGF